MNPLQRLLTPLFPIIPLYFFTLIAATRAALFLLSLRIVPISCILLRQMVLAADRLVLLDRRGRISRHRIMIGRDRADLVLLLYARLGNVKLAFDMP